MFIFEHRSTASVGTSVDIALVLVYLISQQFNIFTSYFADLAILTHVLSIYLPLYTFASEVYTEVMHSIKESYKSPGEESLCRDVCHLIRRGLESRLKRFQALVKLSELVGNAVGQMVFPFILETMFYFSRSFHVLWTTQDITQRYRQLFQFGTALVIVILSAEIVRKVSDRIIDFYIIFLRKNSKRKLPYCLID